MSNLYPANVIANILMITPRRVGQLVKEGVFEREGTEFDLIKTVQAYIRFIKGGAGAEDINEAKRRRAVADADMIEIALAKERGNLVDAEWARRRAFDFSRGFRDAIQNFPVRYAAVIGADLGTDAVKVNAALDKRLRDYLGDIADRKLGI